MYSTLHSVGLEPEVNISAVTIVHVVLVEHIIQALIEVLQVEQNHRPSSLHANLYLIDVSANLIYKYIAFNLSYRILVMGTTSMGIQILGTGSQYRVK